MEPSFQPIQRLSPTMAQMKMSAVIHWLPQMVLWVDCFSSQLLSWIVLLAEQGSTNSYIEALFTTLPHDYPRFCCWLIASATDHLLLRLRSFPCPNLGCSYRMLK